MKPFGNIALVALCLLILSAGVSLAQLRLLNNDGKQFVAPGSMRQSDWSNPKEMARPWASATVYVPGGSGRVQKMSTAKLTGWTPKKSKKFAAIIWLHGCSGLYRYDLDRAKFLARQGYLVVALPSFARSKYAKSCDQRTLQGGLYRGALGLRQFDIGYALERLRDLTFVDPKKIALFGLSEGGNLAATFRPRNNRQQVTVRIIEGWTCHAGWPEWAGMNASKNERVLSILGAKDPWFEDKPWLQGDCGKFMNKSNGSRSIVYGSRQLAGQHALVDFSQPRRDVLTFLRTYLQP